MASDLKELSEAKWADTPGMPAYIRAATECYNAFRSGQLVEAAELTRLRIDLAEAREAMRAQDNLAAVAAQNLTNLAIELAEAQAICSGVMQHIPMNFLQAHDAPGATGPTKALDLVAAVRAWAESRWEDRRRVEALVKRSKEIEHDRDAAKAEAERLREALVMFVQGGCYVCGGDCASANPPVSLCPMQIARAALQEKPMNECSCCGATGVELRRLNDGWGPLLPQITCEECFPRNNGAGACFDDMPQQKPHD